MFVKMPMLPEDNGEIRKENEQPKEEEVKKPKASPKKKKEE